MRRRVGRQRRPPRRAFQPPPRIPHYIVSDSYAHTTYTRSHFPFVLLPQRKFKIGVAVPPSNDVDIYTQDLSFVAIPDETGVNLAGFTVVVRRHALSSALAPRSIRVCLLIDSSHADNVILQYNHRII